MDSPKLSIIADIVALLLSHYLLYAASAASGGRMGGSFYSSSSSKASSRAGSSFRHQHHHYYGSSSLVLGSVSYYLIITIFVGIVLFLLYLSIVEGRISVLQVQVGLSAKAGSLQAKLTEIALTTDSSTANGWKSILNETIASLLRHRNCYLYGHSSVTYYWTTEDAEQCFKHLTKEEQLKFEVESVVNINNIKRQREIVPKANKVDKDCIVVTVLVAAQGSHDLPMARTTDNVKKALRSLREIGSSKIKAVEVLWSPQDEADCLSIEELLENYPQLRRLLDFDHFRKLRMDSICCHHLL